MVRSWRRLPRIVVALALVAAFTAAGCVADDGNDDRPGSSTAPRGTAAPSAAGTPGTRVSEVTVALLDFELDLSATMLAPGAYVFVAEQKGRQPHALSINGPGVDNKATSTIEPGGARQRLHVTLEPGTYELWCPVGDHRARGMTATISVRRIQR